MSYLDAKAANELYGQKLEDKRIAVDTEVAARAALEQAKADAAAAIAKAETKLAAAEGAVLAADVAAEEALFDLIQKSAGVDIVPTAPIPTP